MDKVNDEIVFNPFPKIARLSRECSITEKIDGTNSSIYIGENGEFLPASRNRWITIENDNYGFAKWATEHRDELLKLGVGHHFGEWWGQGIQRKYNMTEKRWSLFNISRWCLHNEEPKIISINSKTKEEKYQIKLPECCHLVPVLYQGIFNTNEIDSQLNILKTNGSVASKGFMNPEGVVIYHIAGNLMFKKTILNDEKRKDDNQA